MYKNTSVTTLSATLEKLVFPSFILDCKFSRNIEKHGAMTSSHQISNAYFKHLIP